MCMKKNQQMRLLMIFQKLYSGESAHMIISTLLFRSQKINRVLKKLYHNPTQQTFYMGQLDKNSIASFWKKVSVDSFDFIIDDGLHTFEAGSCFFEHSYNYLCDNGIYVIEDVCINDFLKYKNFFLSFRCYVDYICLKRPNQKLGDNNLILIRKF